MSGLAVGTTTITATRPDSSGASIAIKNHPIQGPVFSGPHLQPWDCKTNEAGLGQPADANCNAAPLVDYLYVSTAGGGYVAYDVNSPPANVATITNDRGATVRNIIRRERGAINRGLYAFAVLHDPAPLGARSRPRRRPASTASSTTRSARAATRTRPRARCPTS